MSSRYELLHHRSRTIKQIAKQNGFAFAGIAKARRLDEHEKSLKSYLEQQHHGQMHYMENHFEKRLDPRVLHPGTKSVISLLYNYYPESFYESEAPVKITRYALGKDYHFVVKNRMREMVKEMQQQLGEFSYRVFVDSAPVLERAWAREAGLGWIGKNTMLINPKQGSFFFLAEILADMELAYDKPMQKDFCGNCRRCIDACPTDALKPYKIDASRCISYLTIENKNEQIPEEFREQYQKWIFGCDICQEVCPWNRFSITHQEPEFEPHEKLLSLSKQQWQELTREEYQQLFKKSTVKRAKFEGLKRNIHFLNENNQSL
ncbi:MAG: tRNA epoxyqueuosine(34) reductase QueG [Bacteroidales bacterium]|nr:tRNA epoxyqueuosine(34) reductase QueG [Bacteroidales bacterium]MCF8327216.1 tRNA epoxyqueuosine(34) reductase QueG [Bacteroidales bacterium]